jgi:predicted DNA-binding transcriptional regulator YafY
VEPLGLVSKAGTWYLLAGVDGQPRVYRVSRIEGAELTDETFSRPAGFDLRSAWTAQVERFKAGGPERVSVRIRVAPEVSGQFSRVLGDHVIDLADGGVAVLEFPACEAAVSLLTAFGGAVEVLEPEDLRQSLAEIGHQLSSLYGGGAVERGGRGARRTR